MSIEQSELRKRIRIGMLMWALITVLLYTGLGFYAGGIITWRLIFSTMAILCLVVPIRKPERYFVVGAACVTALAYFSFCVPSFYVQTSLITSMVFVEWIVIAWYVDRRISKKSNKNA